MEITRCLNCMQELNGQNVCPHCGFIPSEYEQPAIALKGGSVLRERYFVGKVLGQGGFGITYVGFDLLLNIKVAIKEYFPSGNATRNHQSSNALQWTTGMEQEKNWRNGCESFLKEARKMARIDSVPNIVRVRDTFEENQTAYIVMDFVEGITLKEALKKNGVMPYSKCISLLAPLIRSLGQVHKDGIVHRDISPDNIMIEPDGNIRLLDLGAAKDLSAAKQGGVSMLVTKNGFSPPEQYMESGTIGSWTDVYSMCATIYYCLTGKVIPDAMDRLAKDELSFDVPVAEKIPQEVIAILKDGLALSREKRIQTMEDLFNRFSPYIDYTGTTDLRNMAMEYGQTHKSVLTPEQKKKRLLKWLIPSVSVLVVAVIAVILVIVKPWRVTVERLGNSNSNMLNDGGYAVIDNEYEYYKDQNGSIHICPYVESAQSFYTDQGEVIADSDNNYINVGENKIYFIQGALDGSSYYICQMDFDGSNVEQLYGGSRQLAMMQYVLFSNDKEYLYFWELDGEGNQDLVRMNLAKMTVETLLSENVMWYNIAEDALYYTLFEDNGVNLYKSDFSAKKGELLRSDELFGYGFIEDEEIFLYSYDQNCLVGLDMQGNQVDAIHSVEMDDTYYTYAYGDGWLYYMNMEDANLHRVRKDGTGDEVIISGIYVISVCYQESIIWIQEGQVVNGVPILTRTSLASKDGTNILVLVDADVNQTESGLLYRYENGEVTITGYVGNALDVGIPYMIDGCYVTNIEDGALPSGHNYFLYAEDDYLTYEWDSAGTGLRITGYSGELTSFMIPESIGGYPVTEIGSRAFEYNDEIESVSIPEGVKTIGTNAFFSCDLLSYVGLPNSLITIDDMAFYSCPELTAITLPDNLEVIGEYAFSDSGLTSITFPESLKEIGAGAFWGNYFTAVTIPAGVEEIGDCTFNSIEESLLKIEVDENNSNYVTVDGVLYTKDMQTLVCFPNGIEGTFTVPSGVVYIVKYAFYNSSISEVVLPDSVKEIGNNAFYSCQYLEKITIPESVSFIGESAFASCSQLGSITIGQDCTLEEPTYFTEDMKVYYYVHEEETDVDDDDALDDDTFDDDTDDE